MKNLTDYQFYMMNRLIDSAKGTSKLGKILNKLGFKIEAGERTNLVSDSITVWCDNDGRQLIIQHFLKAKPNIYFMAFAVEQGQINYDDVFFATKDIASHGDL